MKDDILHVRSIRVSDALWADLGARAKEVGVTRSAFVLSQLEAPSFSAALETVEVATTVEGRAELESLASHPRLARTTGSRLRAIATGLNVLANRWPR